MEKEEKNNSNKGRLIFWGIIFTILLIMSATGVVMFYKGYGERGSIVYRLKPISKSFNSMDAIKSYSTNNGVTISSKVGNKELIVTYIDSNSTTAFYFNYVENNGIKMIKSEYTSVDKAKMNVILPMLLQAVSNLNGKTDDISAAFSATDFYKMDIKDGISIVSDTNKEIVSINLEKSILDCDLSQYGISNKTSEKNTFYENSKKIIENAQTKYSKGRVDTNTIYSNAQNCTKIDEEDDGYNYRIEFDKNSSITKIYITNGMYQYLFNGTKYEASSFTIDLIADYSNSDKASQYVACEETEDLNIAKTEDKKETETKAQTTNETKSTEETAKTKENTTTENTNATENNTSIEETES